MDKTNGQKITEEEIKAAAGVLKKLESGFLPFPIFLEVARLAVMPIIDVVPVRDGPNGTQVLLTQRDSDDPYWPGMWHNPGTVIRASDKQGVAYVDAFTRIADELGLADLPRPHFVASLLHYTRRGGELTQVYWVELTEEPRFGTFFDASVLPQDTIESHVQLIRTAAQAFQKAKTNCLPRY